MKNILVLKHYKLKNPTGWDPNNEAEWSKNDILNRIDRISLYEEMKQLCISSAKKFVIGLDDIVVHDSEVDDIQCAFKQHFYDLYRLWSQGNVNILYADLDVLFVRKFDWFANSEKYIMYDDTNSGVRYHGSDMEISLWNHAFELCEKWDSTKWDYEQDIYVSMRNMTAGYIDQQKYIPLVVNKPDYGSMIDLYHDHPEAKAIHFHSTRGTQQVDKMKSLSKYLGID